MLRILEKTKQEIITLCKAMEEIDTLGKLLNKPSITAVEWENIKERLYSALLEAQAVCVPEKA